ncbi:MAG: GNAT family N-acetyltransferase [Thermomicrobiales bacterium]
MSAPRYLIQRLAEHHDRSAFSSGNASLDAYLTRAAGQDVRRRVAAVYIACEENSADICGYYTLSASDLEAVALPEADRKRLPRYPRLPAVLLGRLATDLRWRGIGLGVALLYDAFRRCHRHNDFGVMFIVVDPFPEARTFYARHGFRDIPDQERMYIPMTEVAKLVAGEGEIDAE